MTPIQSLRYIQGFALGDGWIHNKLDRFRLYAYDPSFAGVIRQSIGCVKREFGLTGSESWGADRLTGTHEWRFEVGGSFAVSGMNLGLLKSAEGPYFLAGLWDADGNWSTPDESHPLGQARIFGNYHIVRVVKHSLRHQFGIVTGRQSVVTREGHTSKIGEHLIITRTNVYGSGVLARSMSCWVESIGSKMLLKKRRELLEKAV